jgi:uncharacterized membrane protein
MYGEVLGAAGAGGAAAAAAGGALPFTGYGITIAGFTLTLSWMLAISLVAVAVGILLLRWDARRG